MHFGALVALAEVGIGINLAFGVLKQFRDWARNALLGTTKATCASMEAAIAEFRAKGQNLSVREAVQYAETFENRTNRINQAASALAILSSLGLYGFIYYVADHADEVCDYWCKRGVCIASLGPMLLSWLAIVALYSYVRARLFLISKKHSQLVEFMKSLNLPIQPTDPGALQPASLDSGSWAPQAQPSDPSLPAAVADSDPSDLATAMQAAVPGRERD
jgi:hypothetical protein